MRIRFSALFVLALLLPGLAYAQTGTLRGVVTDAASAEVLPGANLFLVELGTGAASDINGNYEIANVPTGSYTLRVTFVGYKQFEQDVTVNSGTNVRNVALDPDFTGLEEVVVTGIASATSKARAEVAVGHIDTEELLEQNSYQDVSQLLNGKVAGVSVQPSSGNVGGGIRFNMRSNTGLNGDGQPIIYIDGVRIDNAEVGGFGVGGQGTSMLANINPEDIESIDVLKGPAGAALYGTSGSNGVVLIKTKRGQLAGGGIAPFNVSYKGVFGTNEQAEPYTDFNAGTPDVANSFFREGTIAQHSLSVSGGSDVVRYFTSYDKRFEEGHLRNNEQDRQSFRANFEAFPSDKVTIRANTGYTLNEVLRPQNDNNIFGYLGNTLLARSPFIFTDSSAIEGVNNVQRITRFLGSVEAEFAPLPNLKIRGSVGFDGTELRNDESFPSNLSYSGRTNGERNIFNRRNEQYTYDLNARYSYNIGSSLSATTIIGGQAFNRINRNFFITKQNFQTELITNVGAGGDFIQGDEGFTHSREAGVFGQQEFAFQNRFFLTLGLRRDFASAIGADAPSIFYPKASAAVRLDQFPGLLPSAINFLKFRAAYGETGQLPSLLDASPVRWEAEPSGYGAGAVLSSIGNAAIEPERVREFEVGLETELFNNIGLDLTYYSQRANDSIIDFRNPPSTGLTASAVPFNVGESKGWGVEASLSASPLRTRNFGVDFTFLWSYQENEVLDLSGAQPIFSGFDVNVIKEGLPRDAFYTFRSKPVFADDGTFTGLEPTACEDSDSNPVDCSAEGAIAAREFLGTPYPKHNGSFSLNVRFLKNFNFNALAEWSLDQSVYNGTAFFQVLFGGLRARNIARVQTGQVDPCNVGFCDGDGMVLPEFADIVPLEVGSAGYREAAEVVAATSTSVRGASTDGNFVEEADFFKIREISLRYDFTDLLRKARFNEYVRSLSFSVAARNIYTSSDYSGADPEVNFTGARSSSRANDFLTLPSPQVLYFTFIVGF